MNPVITYVPGTQGLHCLNPVANLAIAATLIVAGILCRSVGGLASLIAITCVLACISRSQGPIMRMATIMAPLTALVFILQWLFGENALQATVVGLRLLEISLPLALALGVTRLDDLADALVEHTPLPYPYAFALTSTLRFVPILMRDMERIKKAQLLRGLPIDSKRPLVRVKSTMSLVVPLLTTAVARTPAAALAARQRGIELRDAGSSRKQHPLNHVDRIAVAASIVAATLICVIM